jgi:site-specific recombinase XerD
MGGITNVTKIKADDLKRYIIATRDKEKWSGLPYAKRQKISATTVNTYVRAIKGFWSWFEQEGIIKTNPLAAVRAPKLPKRLPKVFNEEEMTRIFDSVVGSPRETALLLLLLDSGISLGEIAGLNDSEVNTASGTLRIYREKTQKERYAYFSPPTADAIDAYRSVRPQSMAEPRLFLTRNGYPLTGKNIQTIHARIGRKVVLSHRLSPHKLRHSFATLSLKYDSNLEYIRIMLGHSDIRTTAKAYLNAASTDVAEASRRSSPVVNLGVGGSKHTPVEPITEQDTDRHQGETVIVIQIQPQGSDPAAGIQPVAYDNKQKKRKKGDL